MKVKSLQFACYTAPDVDFQNKLRSKIFKRIEVFYACNYHFTSILFQNYNSSTKANGRHNCLICLFYN